MADDHTKAHPGFKKTAQKMADKQHIPVKEADAELASFTRRAGMAAREENPRLNRVK